MSYDDVTAQIRKGRAEEDNTDRGVNQVLMACYYKLKDEGREHDAQAIKKMRISEVDGSTRETGCYSNVEALALLLDCR